MKAARFIHIGFVAMTLALAPCAANAQQQPTIDAIPRLDAPDMTQYSGVIEFKGPISGGAPDAHFVLRCGYTVENKQILPDPTSNDLLLASFLVYNRYQFIDGQPVISALDPAQPLLADRQEVVIQVSELNSTFKAKSCKHVSQTDTLQGCTPIQPFLTVAQVNASMAGLLMQCGRLMGQFRDQINPSLYDAKKAQVWKNQLSKTLAIVEK